jgi:hypothetical protein
MRTSARILRCLLVLACQLLATLAFANAPCRIAFDMGSSGIRAGASSSKAVGRADIDYLGPLWAGRGLKENIDPTIRALLALPREAGFAEDCARVGGGFSAWRIALQQDAEKLVVDLARIEAASGVAVLVIPQATEGAYGYFGARQLLGERLLTSHVLDIGGGSLQIAGERSTFGDMLGQKIWHRALCQLLRSPSTQPCLLQPMSGVEIGEARRLVREKLGGVRVMLPESISMTAISRPVTQGVAPAVARLLDQHVGQSRLQRAELTAAIDSMAHLTIEETTKRLEVASKYAVYLLSDMLLVEGLMQATGVDVLHLAEIDLTNVPGLLADDKAFDWVDHYGCYLERLRAVGLDAYVSDPATCLSGR